MISEEQIAQIRHLFHAEHWKIGTIASQLGLHPLTVRAALETDRFRSHPRLRDRLVDPFLDFLRQNLQQYPRLRATRLYQMIRPRGYTGSISQLRRVVAELRPTHPEAFLRLNSFPGEMAQADWAHFGEVSIGGGPPFVCFRSHSLLQPRSVAGVLLRSMLGELSPRPRSRLP